MVSWPHIMLTASDGIAMEGGKVRLRKWCSDEPRTMHKTQNKNNNLPGNKITREKPTCTNPMMVKLSVVYIYIYARFYNCWMVLGVG